MKLLPLISAAVLTFGSVASAQTILIDENLDSPNGETVYLPPNEGEQYKKFNPNLTAWANKDGQLAITPGEKLGNNASGGLSVKVARATGTGGYLALNCENISLPVKSPEEIEDLIKSLTFEFAIKIPTGKTVGIYLIAHEKMLPADPTLRDDFKARGYSNRADIQKIPGNDEYTNHTLKGSDIAPDQIARLTEFSGEMVKAGALNLVYTLVFNISGSEWTDNSEFLVDNIKVSSSK